MKKKICIQKLESAIFYINWYAWKMTKKLTRNGERKQQQLSYLSRVEKLESHFHLNRRLSLYQVNLSYLHSPPKFQSLKLEFSLIEFFFSNSNEQKKKKKKTRVCIYRTCIHINFLEKQRLWKNYQENQTQQKVRGGAAALRDWKFCWGAAWEFDTMAHVLKWDWCWCWCWCWGGEDCWGRVW